MAKLGNFGSRRKKGLDFQLKIGPLGCVWIEGEGEKNTRRGVELC